MAVGKSSKYESRFRDMKFYLTYLLFLLVSIKSLAQIDSLNQVNKQGLQLEKIPEASELIEKNQIQAKQNNGLSNGEKLNYMRYLFFNSRSDYYKRNVVKTPVKMSSLNKTLNTMPKQDRKAFYKILGERKMLNYSVEKEIFPLNLTDTLLIPEESIIHKKNSIYESILIAETTQDTLNGFYEITAGQNTQKYDYSLGYIIYGSPYIFGIPNVFEFYKKKRMVKRRFFVSDSLRGGMYAYKQITEDYFPISKRKWRREIRTWPDEELLVEDTVVYKKDKTYFNGIQNIYKTENYRPNKTDSIKTKRLLLKTHHYKKGHIRSVTEYSYHPSYQNFAIQQIKKLNIPKRGSMTAAVEEYDPAGQLLYRGGYENVPFDKSDKNGCPNGLYKFDKYYTGIEPDEQCFQPVGEHYELDPDYVYSKRKTTFKLDSLTLVYQAYFEKGLLVKFIKKRLFPIENLDDSLTQKVYGKTVSVYEEKVTDYKKRMSITQYFKYPNKKLIIRIKKKYENCIEIYFPKRGWYKAYCEDESLRREYGERYKFKEFIEYYDPSGKKIIDEEYTGRYEDFLNNYQKN